MTKRNRYAEGINIASSLFFLLGKLNIIDMWSKDSCGIASDLVKTVEKDVRDYNERRAQGLHNVFSEQSK